MHLVSQALTWVTAVLFGPPASGRTTRSAAPEKGPSLLVRHPSPQQWAHILRHARCRRAPHLWPSPARPAVEGSLTIGDLVRAYVLLRDEWTCAPASPAGEAR